MPLSAWAAVKNCFHPKINQKKKSLVCRLDPLDHLPIDVIQLIYNRLDLISRCYFHVVCRSWRNVSMTLIPPTGKEPPWALLLWKNRPNFEYHLVNLSHNTRVKFNGPPVELSDGVTPDFKIYASHGSFFILSFYNSNLEHSLYDPFSGKFIPLPLHAAVGGYVGVVHDVAFSSHPSPANLREGRCKLVLAMYRGRDTVFYVCRPGIDFYWKVFVVFGAKLSSLAFHGGRLYCIDINRLRILTSEVFPSRPSWVEMTFHSRHFRLPQIHNFTYRNNYLVKSDDDLLMVSLLEHIGKMNSDVRFQVFRVGKGGIEVEEVKDLGEKMLFIGEGCSMSWHSGQSFQHCKFFKSNCIYFFDRLEGTRYGVGRFDLRDQTTVCRSILPNYGPPFNTCHALPIWITPPT